MSDQKANKKTTPTLTRTKKCGHSLAYGKACKAYGLANALAYKYGYKGESIPGNKRTERGNLSRLCNLYNI